MATYTAIALDDTGPARYMRDEDGSVILFYDVPTAISYISHELGLADVMEEKDLKRYGLILLPYFFSPTVH